MDGARGGQFEIAPFLTLSPASGSQVRGLSEDMLEKLDLEDEGKPSGEICMALMMKCQLACESPSFSEPVGCVVLTLCCFYRLHLFYCLFTLIVLTDRVLRLNPLYNLSLV